MTIDLKMSFEDLIASLLKGVCGGKVRVLSCDMKEEIYYKDDGRINELWGG